MGPLGVPWGSLGVPWGCLGVPWDVQGNFLRFVRKCPPNSEQTNLSNVPRLLIEASLPFFARVAQGARGNGSQSAAQTPPGHVRRGLRLRELNKLPQIITIL